MAFDISKFASTVPSCRPRTIEAVTEEILDIKQRVAEDFMELGQRLCEAKELLPHGEWLPWLEQRVQFSERTAQKFMQLAREYESNPKLASDLGSEKAFALLALPKEEREQIAAEGVTVNGKTKAPADLTTREVKQIVAERKAATSVVQEAKPVEDVCPGQTVIAAWMLGGTTPGRESGLCVCMMQLDPEKEPAPMLLWWDGTKSEWQFKHGAAVEQEPVGWMRLPEWR